MRDKIERGPQREVNVGGEGVVGVSSLPLSSIWCLRDDNTTLGDRRK